MTVAGRTLIDHEYYEPGSHSVSWDGKDDEGEVVLPGVYDLKMFVIVGEESVQVATAKVTIKETAITEHISQNAHWKKEYEPYGQ